MYGEFSLITIDTLLLERKIVITTNMDLDKNKIDQAVIEVYERQTKTPLIFNYEFANKKLIINLLDWPIPNSEYIIGVKNIHSVTGETLENIKRRIAFPSGVISKAKLLSPSMFEKVKSLDVKIDEIADDAKDLVGSYFIEVSTDNAFINNVISTFTTSKEITLEPKSIGQYYIRIRPEIRNNNTVSDYGVWSETITFIYKEVKTDVPPEMDNEYLPDYEDETDNEDDPIVILDDFEIINHPGQGESPQDGFVFEFNMDIDEFSLDDIIVIRKGVR